MHVKDRRRLTTKDGLRNEFQSSLEQAKSQEPASLLKLGKRKCTENQINARSCRMTEGDES